MRLDKLRGYGQWFAFAVPFLFLFSMGFIFGVTVLAYPAEPGGEPASWFGDAVAVWLVLWALIVLAGLVVAIDLEWIEHPRTNTPMTYAALAGMAVATLAFLFFLADGIFHLADQMVFLIDAFLVFAGIGVYLVLINVVGLQAGLLGSILPWIGTASGALFLVAALLIVVGLTDAAGLAFFPGWALYLGWSLWLGFRLGGNAPAAAAA
jgi:hypothetical protein